MPPRDRSTRGGARARRSTPPPPQVCDDRAAVLRAFAAQDDVLGLPEDWEAELGKEKVVEDYDPLDATYILLPPGEDDEGIGTWWPFGVIELL